MFTIPKALGIFCLLLVALLSAAEAKDALKQLKKSVRMSVERQGDRFVFSTKFKLPDGLEECQVEIVDGVPTPINVTPQPVYVKAPSKVQKLTKVFLLEIDYNPCGHIPIEWFSVPHFDVHWYHENDADLDPRKQLDLCEPNYDIVPYDFVCFNEEYFAPLDEEEQGNIDSQLVEDTHGIKNMGTHWFSSEQADAADWIDPVFIQGTFNGTILFYESMFPVRTITETVFHSYTPTYPNKTHAFFPDLIVSSSDGSWMYLTVYGAIP